MPASMHRNADERGLRVFFGNLEFPLLSTTENYPKLHAPEPPSLAGDAAMSSTLMTSHEVAVRSPTSIAAGSKKGANARQYSIVVQGGITHESGETDVKEALMTHYGFRDADAQQLSTQFVNGISSRRGSELMEAVATFGREMVLWLIKGLRFALRDPGRKKQEVAKVSSMRKYLEYWRKICTKLFGSTAETRHLHLVEKLEFVALPKTSAQYSRGTLGKPCFVLFDDDAGPRVSEKIVDFIKAAFCDVNGQPNDQKATLKICKAFLAAMINAELARKAEECPTHARLLKPFGEGHLNASFESISELTKEVRTAHKTQLVRRPNGQFADIHKFVRRHFGIAGMKFVLNKLHSSDVFHSERARLETQFTHLQCYSCGLRFCEMNEVRFHHYLVERYVNIGMRGVMVICFIMDDGKQNDSGHIELAGALDHRDPALSLPTAMAELGHVVLHEPRVDSDAPSGTRRWFNITDANEFMTIKLLQLSSEAASGGGSRAKNVYTTAARRAKQLLEEYMSVVSRDGEIKATHQARLEAINALQEAGIDGEMMRRFLRKLRDEMQKSYLSPLDRACILQLAGFNKDFPLSAVAPHLDPTISASAAAHTPGATTPAHACTHARTSFVKP